MATVAAPGFRPVHDAHAIEQLVVSVGFDRPLTDAAIHAAIEVMGGFQEALPGRNEVRGMGISIGPQGVSAISAIGAGTPDGLIRTFSDPRGVVVKELRLERHGITFRTMLYTRWDAVWAEARGFVSQLLPRLAEVNLNAYSLAYTDKFIWTGPPQTCQPAALLRTGSPYISPVSFEAADLWHSYCGRFVRVSDELKRLEVVNADCVDELDTSEAVPQPRRVVRISTTITDMYNQPGFNPVQFPATDAMARLDAAMPAVHLLLKDVFGRVVNDQMSTRVGLNANAS